MLCVQFCSRGGTGRRVRLRSVWGNSWRFESSREHHFEVGSGKVEVKNRRTPSIVPEDLNSSTTMRNAQFVNGEAHIVEPAAGGIILS